MGRGLDGYFLIPVVLACCVVLRVREGQRPELSLRAVSNNFRWLWRGGNTSSHSEQSS